MRCSRKIDIGPRPGDKKTRQFRIPGWRVFAAPMPLHEIS